MVRVSWFSCNFSPRAVGWTTLNLTESAPSSSAMRTMASTWPTLPRITVKMICGRMPAATRLRTACRAAAKDPGTPRTHSWVAASMPSMLTDTKRSGDLAISAAISGVHSRPLVSIVSLNSFTPDDLQQTGEVGMQQRLAAGQLDTSQPQRLGFADGRFEQLDRQGGILVARGVEPGSHPTMAAGEVAPFGQIEINRIKRRQFHLSRLLRFHVRPASSWNPAPSSRNRRKHASGLGWSTWPVMV